MAKKKSSKKSNVINSVNGISVQIYDGITIFAKSDNFKTVDEAIISAQRIIKNQKSINPDSTAYAVVWNKRNMVGYFD